MKGPRIIIGDKRPQDHVQTRHLFGYRFLPLGRFTHKAVIKHRAEAFVGGKLDVIYRVFAGVVPELPQTRRIS
jgi:hypothetical protein